MSYHQFITKESAEPAGSFEAFFYHDSINRDAVFRGKESDDQRVHRIGPRGWYWQVGWPGCLPDGDLSGPFKTEAEAIADANSF